MAKFITCSVPKTDYRGSMQVNNPINIDLCKYISKGRLKHYPDNDGYPTIEFNGCYAKWVFHSDELRDAEFKNIIRKGV